MHLIYVHIIELRTELDASLGSSSVFFNVNIMNHHVISYKSFHWASLIDGCRMSDVKIFFFIHEKQKRIKAKQAREASAPNFKFRHFFLFCRRDAICSRHDVDMRACMMFERHVHFPELNFKCHI
jgi:hypothetical protein